MEKELVVKLHKNFEDCVHEKDGVEFWYARDLQNLLGYDKWQNFEKAIDRAKIACENAKQKVSDHFTGASKTIAMPKGASKEVEDIMLTRYACYLIAQNGDPRKSEIAFAMTYFAIQTRKQELVEQRLAEWDRLQIREKLSHSEKELSGIIFERGVDGHGFSRVRSKGDQALFGGFTTQDMKNKLSVPDNRPLADFLPSVTIKAKDLATEITNHNLKQNLSISGETDITGEHVKNNSNMRDMLRASGIEPESLPPAEDIKKVARKLKSANKKLPAAGKSLK
ncbi:MAG: DNA damage-inducible protein D [Candidatus Magasanikbacteria bacterium]|nr:DNA damage-inducible protein D [Candidatus Magasanikbacteria bacterium]